MLSFKFKILFVSHLSLSLSLCCLVSLSLLSPSPISLAQGKICVFCRQHKCNQRLRSIRIHTKRHCMPESNIFSLKTPASMPSTGSLVMGMWSVVAHAFSVLVFNDGILQVGAPLSISPKQRHQALHLRTAHKRFYVLVRDNK